MHCRKLAVPLFPVSQQCSCNVVKHELENHILVEQVGLEPDTCESRDSITTTIIITFRRSLPLATLPHI
ncbi:hypothetical protein Q7C36_022823 [Tachysurus vachellii]|uniref:Uncharacterized protein n=1 Tax=Tachysurus vachellii TaxID=175792 RepID=A0AA88IHH6_TACVA|nr:hypothetical protein Q7C36_022823 [Tachysurus vachellii]